MGGYQNTILTVIIVLQLLIRALIMSQEDRPMPLYLNNYGVNPSDSGD
jgi:hypothetical protein